MINVLLEKKFSGVIVGGGGIKIPNISDCSQIGRPFQQIHSVPLAFLCQ